MSEPDVVAELDEWLAREATTLKHYPADDVDTGLLQRARDEIVRLREIATRPSSELHALTKERDEARAEALAECIRICPECAYRIMALDTVGARHLRALKDKRDE